MRITLYFLNKKSLNTLPKVGASPKISTEKRGNE